MALYAIGDRDCMITTIPHPLLFDGWKRCLTNLELQAISVELDRLVRNCKTRDVCTARWLTHELSPQGHLEWEGTPFLKIWDKACGRDRTRTCWCFALLLWEHMIQRPEPWHFLREDLDAVPMAGTRYFRCRQNMISPGRMALESVLGC